MGPHQEFGKRNVAQCVFVDWILCTNWPSATVPDPSGGQSRDLTNSIKHCPVQKYTIFHSVTKLPLSDKHSETYILFCSPSS